MTSGLEAENERLREAGWRSCIDHIIKPDSACPVCKITELEAENERLKALIPDIVKVFRNAADKLEEEQP